MQRIHALRQQMEQQELAALLITDEINVRYLSGFTGDSSFLLISADSAAILSDRRYETQIASECPSLAAAIRPPSQSMLQLVQSVVADSGFTCIGVEQDSLLLSQFRGLEQSCPTVEWLPTSSIVERLRMIKDADEIEITRKSIQIAQRTLQSVLPKLTPKWTERQVAHELEATMRTLGAEGVSFEPIVGADQGGALPHYRPGDRELGMCDTLLIDWGAKYQGYASDLTRTFYQNSASDKFRRCYEAVLQAQLAAIDQIRDGALASDVDAAARNILTDSGLGDAFKHGLGHGIGLQIHENPRMASTSTETLQTGMIITVEPGVYFEGDFGIRIEDDILVTETGHEVLSNLPKGLDEARIFM